MTYTKNIKKIEEQLASHGINVERAKQTLTGGQPGFFLNLTEETDPEQASILLNRIRSLLYSWLHCLDLKSMYCIRITNKAIQVRRKVALVGKGAFGTLSQVGPGVFTEAIPGFSDSIMPTEESVAAEERLLSLIDEMGGE